MPLPDAPPTDQSRVYREFASKTALPGASGAITAALLDNFKNSLFLDEFSEDELRRLFLIQIATGTGSTSGALPATGKVETTNTSSSGTVVEAFAPGIGEAWKINGVSIAVDGMVGVVTHELYISDDDVFDKDTACMLVSMQSSSSIIPLNEITVPNGDIVIDNKATLYYEASGTFTSVNVNVATIRVR